MHPDLTQNYRTSKPTDKAGFSDFTRGDGFTCFRGRDTWKWRYANVLLCRGVIGEGTL